MPVPPKAWADGPFELISPTKSGAKKESTLTGASKMASEMTVIHNLLLRGINSIYNQCLGVSEKGTDKDKLDFVNYAYQWVDMLEEHHQAEEEQFFPQMGELAGVPGLMDSSVEQHQLFHHGLEKFQTYLNEVKAGSAVFDGQTLKDIVDEFMPILRAHLDDEIDALVALEKYDDKCDWAAWFSGKAEKLGQQYFKDARYRTDVFPLMFHLHDSSYGDGAWADFPPLPWLLQFIVRWMFMGKHADWWRFAPCDYRSARRGLPFAQEGTLDNN